MSASFTCREVASLLTEYRERTIPWTVRVRTGLHLRLCPGCHDMLLDLELLPLILQRYEPLDPVEFLPIGQAALANVLGRLQEPRKTRRLPATAVPAPVQGLLSSVADLPLRLLAQTHAALMRGEAPPVEPYLPEEVLAQLPPPREWPWRQGSRGLRRALLFAEASGPTLSLVHMAPRFSSSAHVHRGTESLLVLAGELEHADRCLTVGDWVHLESGSTHAPYAFDRGCWCLVRDEGTIQYSGRRRWLQAGA
jgi:anti-sigma factor ChrR (cupin superfamily)